MNLNLQMNIVQLYIRYGGAGTGLCNLRDGVAVWYHHSQQAESPLCLGDSLLLPNTMDWQQWSIFHNEETYITKVETSLATGALSALHTKQLLGSITTIHASGYHISNIAGDENISTLATMARVYLHNYQMGQTQSITKRYIRYFDT